MVQFTSQSISFLNDLSLNPNAGSTGFGLVLCLTLDCIAPLHLYAHGLCPESIPLSFYVPAVTSRWCGSIIAWLSLAVTQHLFTMTAFTKHRVGYILHALEGVSSTYMVLRQRQVKKANGLTFFFLKPKTVEDDTEDKNVSFIHTLKSTI